MYLPGYFSDTRVRLDTTRSASAALNAGVPIKFDSRTCLFYYFLYVNAFILRSYFCYYVYFNIYTVFQKSDDVSYFK